MTCIGGASITNDSLILNIDAAGLQSNKYRRSIISWETWVADTTGSTGIYGQNGDGNSRINDVNPWGNTDVVWDVSNQDASSDADGGWNTSNFNIDNRKMYRYTVWIKRKVIGNGSTYLGVYGKDVAGSNEGVLERNTGAVQTNPYWVSQGWWGLANTWYLLVGHVWPAGSGTGADHPDSGIYNTAGTKVANVSRDFVWRDTNTQSIHRSYLYYSTDTATNQQFYQPRVDVCDGSEPSLAELLADSSNRWKSGVDTTSLTLAGPDYDFSTPHFSFTDNQTDSAYVSSASFMAGLSQITVDMWVRLDNTSINHALLSYAVTGSDNEYLLFYEGNFTPKRFHTWFDGTQLLVNADLNVAEWYNIVNVVDGSTNRLYLNGTLILSQTKTGTSLTGGGYMVLGQEQDAVGGTFDTAQELVGDIALARIYNKALSDSERNLNWNATRNRFGR